MAHAGAYKTPGSFDHDMLWPIGLSILAVVGGAFLLRGANWARWLCLTWMLGHVVISVFLHSVSQVVAHAVFFAILLHFLLRPSVTAYLIRRCGS